MLNIIVDKDRLVVINNCYYRYTMQQSEDDTILLRSLIKLLLRTDVKSACTTEN